MTQDTRLARMIDEGEIIRVIHAYCDVVDRNTFEGEHVLQGMRDSLHPNVRVDYGTGVVFQGVDSWIDYTAKLRTRSGLSHHQYSNFIIDVNGDTASVTYHAVAWHWWEDKPGYVMRAGAVFEDELLRTEEGWRISNIRLHVRFTDDPGDKLQQMFPELQGKGHRLTS